MSKNFLVYKVTTWLKYKYYIVVLKVWKEYKICRAQGKIRVRGCCEIGCLTLQQLMSTKITHILT